MTASAAYYTWHHRSADAGRHVVLPDGCRDVLILHGPDGVDEVVLTAFDHSPRAVFSRPGVSMTGYRLRPGAVPCRDVMAAIAENPGQAGAILRGAFGRAGELEQVIGALAMPGATTQAVARAAGLSVRSLQRHLLAQGLASPDTWRMLARARRAAVMLATPEPLAEIAATCGFSDQAHMTREIGRWCARSPAQLRGDAAALAELAQPALGAWTGEQISTR